MKHETTTIFKHTLPRLISVLIAMSSFLATAVYADKPAYTMTTIIDSAYGEQVVAGNYEQAIENISTAGSSEDPFYKATNLCVAYTKIGNLVDAASACDAAVEHAQKMDVDRHGSFSKRFMVATSRTYLALSLTNRGVLRAVTGDVALAHKDFVHALDTKGNSKVAKINLARLADFSNQA